MCNMRTLARRGSRSSVRTNTDGDLDEGTALQLVICEANLGSDLQLVLGTIDGASEGDVGTSDEGGLQFWNLAD
jgi:hypothetical protein